MEWDKYKAREELILERDSARSELRIYRERFGPIENWERNCSNCGEPHYRYEDHCRACEDELREAAHSHNIYPPHNERIQIWE